MKPVPHLIHLLLLAGVMATSMAQEVSIPDAALKATIWLALDKPLPIGTLTEQDMLGLTELDASQTGVQSLEGLGASQNLISLQLSKNRLTSLVVPVGLTSLR